MQKLAVAVKEHRTAVELAPDNGWFQHNLGMAYERQRSYDESAAQYRKTLKVDPGLAYTRYRLGMIYSNHLLLSPVELLEKLAALVPPPRLNLIRYHGVLAPSARDRASIVPGRENDPASESESAHGPCSHRLSWCQLLTRVFSIDVTECPDCGGHMKIVAALTDPASIRSYLEGVGLPARPPPIAPARRDQQSEFEYAA